MNICFWRWLHALSERRIRAGAHHDRRCPNCHRWSSVAGVLRYRDLDEAHTGMTCGGCGYESRWDMRYGPVVVLAEQSLVDERLKTVTGV